MDILVIDIGGTNVKVWKTGEDDKVKIPSERDLTPERLVEKVARVTEGWKYERVSIGYPGTVRHGRPVQDPYALGPGWIRFDYDDAFGCPVRLENDACMQALGSYAGGRMLFLGLGTNLGTTLVDEWHIVPLALGHLMFRDGNFNDALSRSGRKRLGHIAWETAVGEATSTLQAAFLVDYVMLGGGNAKKLRDLPENCRRGGNHNAYFGGLRLWDDIHHVERKPVSRHDVSAPQMAS